MLSCNTIPNIDTEVPYPCLASGKLDGIRGTAQGGKVLSRTLKPIPNKFVQSYFERYAKDLEGLDGELTLRKDPHNFNANQSAFMTITGEPDFVFNVFDDFSDPKLPADVRKTDAYNRVMEMQEVGHAVIDFCQQYHIASPALLRQLYTDYRERGYEGLIVMHPGKAYKFGRSTLLQQISLKLKPSDDAEAVLIGLDELMHNTDAGNSNKKENMVPGGMMGAIIGRMPNGVEMRCGTGFTHAQRQDIWDNLETKYKGLTFTYKFMETFPDTGAPRSPVFKGFRYE